MLCERGVDWEESASPGALTHGPRRKGADAQALPGLGRLGGGATHACCEARRWRLAAAAVRGSRKMVLIKEL